MKKATPASTEVSSLTSSWQPSNSSPRHPKIFHFLVAIHSRRATPTSTSPQPDSERKKSHVPYSSAVKARRCPILSMYGTPPPHVLQRLNLTDELDAFADSSMPTEPCQLSLGLVSEMSSSSISALASKNSTVAPADLLACKIQQ
jgi:hypothetical protein